MMRLIIAVLFTVTLVTFVMANTHHVMLNFFIGPPVQIRLIFLIISAFFSGVLVTMLLMVVWRWRTKAHVQPDPIQQTDFAME